jgi:membrane associated rhomboid family serine protease
MGIYDREYYRRDGPSFLEAITSHGKVCKWLIGINVVVFIIQILTRQEVDLPTGFSRLQEGPVTDYLKISVDGVKSGFVWQFLTYAFLHDTSTWAHIVFNMLFLWWFGTDVEDIYGPREFLAFYLISAVLGGFAFVATNLGNPLASCVGASGAVMAIMVLCALHYPTRIIYLFMLLPVPIWLFVGFYVLQDLFGFLGGGGGRVAFSVHLAGAGFAFVYYKMNWRVLNFWPSLGTRRRQRSRPKLRVFREEEEAPTPVSVAAAAQSGDVDEQLEAKLDAVLEKVARSGQASLTESERAILLRASEIYKRRRS